MNRAVEISVGSLSPTINWKTLKLEEFAFPPLDQQRRIAEILWAVDAAIEVHLSLQKVCLEKKDAWLAEQIPVDQGSGKLHHGLIKKSHSKWLVVLLGEVAKTIGGTGFPHVYQGRKSGVLPFYKVSDMNSLGNERFLSSAENYIDLHQAKELKARIVPSGAVVFPKVGAALLTNKRRITSTDCCIDNNMMAVISECVPSNYLFEFMNRIDFSSIVQMGAVPSVNQSQVEALEFPALQNGDHYNVFQNELRKHDDLVSVVSKHVVALKRVIQSITNSLFSS